MTERWHMSKTWKWLMFSIPYILFYIGIIVYFRSFGNPARLSSARYINRFFLSFHRFDTNESLNRIILAIDLELYYIKSLRFSAALKFFGPKLIMIQKMVRSTRYCIKIWAIEI